MSWIVEPSLSYFQRLCLNVIKCGPLPRHVAIIMDGNRRYASKNRVENAQGHMRGFDKLAETLQWCLELGINEVTVYAFSIENFKRSQEEVDALMKLTIEKMHQLLEEKEKIMGEGVCIRIIGNLGMLSEELRKLIAEATLLTKDNKRAFLNIAFAYTSRDEIVNTVTTIVEGVKNGDLEVEDVDEDLISDCLYTGASPDPEIILRTSGEVRFSDYLLWQISHSYIFFANVLWPEFCIWHLLACVFQYQRCHQHLRKNATKEENEKVKSFLHKLNSKRMMQLESYLL